MIQEKLKVEIFSWGQDNGHTFLDSEIEDLIANVLKPDQIRREAVGGFAYQIGMNMGFDWMSLDEHAEVSKWLNAQAEAYLTQSKEEGEKPSTTIVSNGDSTAIY